MAFLYDWYIHIHIITGCEKLFHNFGIMSNERSSNSILLNFFTNSALEHLNQPVIESQLTTDYYYTIRDILQRVDRKYAFQTDVYISRLKDMNKMELSNFLQSINELSSGLYGYLSVILQVCQMNMLSTLSNDSDIEYEASFYTHLIECIFPKLVASPNCFFMFIIFHQEPVIEFSWHFKLSIFFLFGAIAIYLYFYK